MKRRVVKAREYLAQRKSRREEAARLASEEVSRVARRHSTAMSYYNDKIRLIEEWAMMRTESSNYLFDITDRNKDVIAHAVAVVTGRSFNTTRAFIRELDEDRALREHMALRLAEIEPHTKINVAYGRRCGWYAFARALKPAVLVETGVDLGLGSCILAAALLRNAKEGAPGRYFGTDIRREAGQLFSGVYAAQGQILYGDSIATLEAFDEPIDLFINDSDHSAKYEANEYRIIAAKLSQKAVILGDNSHVTDCLSQFSIDHNRRFLFIKEEPKDHWYPGAGIGISYSVVPG
jgi:predicted O-methyltransferase YrrM